MSRMIVALTSTLALVVAAFGTGVACGQVAPAHAGTRLLRSGTLVVEVGDPQSQQCLWNQGLRFSPVANVVRVRLGGQEFLYSPVGGGALSYLGGLPMEFDIGQEEFQPDPPGYNEGRNGDPFLKIGVGILRRNSAAYNFSTNYAIVELAHTTVTWQEDRAHFVQSLSGSANGYSCRLEEDLVVKNDRLIMNYTLENTGTKAFTTEQYIHNFLSFLGRSVGPNWTLSFPYAFTASPDVAPWSPPGRVRSLLAAAAADVVRVANNIIYMQRISSVPKIWIYKPQDYAGGDLFAVEQTDTQQRLIIGSSIPAAYVGIWTTDYQVSPEQFIQVTLAPGEQIEFTRTYTFRVDSFVSQDATGDGAVDTNDLSVMSSAWLSEPGAVNWQPACDVAPANGERIDLRDFSALASQWRQQDGRPAAVAHWRLDETAGGVAHDERDSHTGTLHNFPSDDSQWVAGMNGGALAFDGTDDYVEIAGYPGITGTRPRTVTAWIKLHDRPTTSQTILAWGRPELGAYWLLEVDANRRLRFSCDGGAAVAWGEYVGDTQWHHIAAVLDPIVPESPHVGDVRLYVDARPQPVFELTEHPVDTGNTETLRIGACHDPEARHHFHGVIDDVRLFDAVLSPAAIRQGYTVTTAE